MRIISGRARGTKLYSLEGLETRPTTDRIKESMFNLLQYDFHDRVVLDLFSGSGALGLEAASRGARMVFCVDSSPKAIQVIRQNIEKTKFAEQVKTACDSALRVVESSDVNVYDVIFMDPPYKAGLIMPVLEAIDKTGIVKSDGLIVVEHAKDDELPAVIGHLSLLKSRSYGITAISIFRRQP